MLLYLSAPENKNLFSQWFEQKSIFMDYIDYTEYPSLLTALHQNRAMPNYRYILIYFDNPPYPIEVIQNAIAYIRRYFHSRIIIFAAQCPETTALFGALSDMGLRELVPVSKDTDLIKELEECMSVNGKDFLSSTELSASARVEEARTNFRQRLVIPPDFTLKVGVAGVQFRTGTTTQSFRIYHALRELGFCPCVVDVRRAFIETLAAFYSNDMSINGSFMDIKGITFATDVQVGTDCNAYIFDFGVISEDILPEYEQCSLRLLCSGAKAWELINLAEALQGYPGVVKQIIFSFSSKAEEADAENLLKDIAPAAFAPICTDIWETNADWHVKLLTPLVKGVMNA